MKKVLFGLILISTLVISGCSNNTILDSTMQCEDGRIVSIPKGCE